MHKILMEVCEKHGLRPVIVTGRGQTSVVVKARHEVFWRCANETSATYGEIARIFDRDHTSVLNGIRRHADRINGTHTARKPGLRPGDCPLHHRYQQRVA